MQVFLLFFLFMVSGAWFWFCYVYVTQDRRAGWKGMIMWVILAMLLRVPLAVLAESTGVNSYETLGRIGGTALMYAFLYIVLTLVYHVEDISKKLKIISGHFAGFLVLTLPLHCS